MNKRLVLFDFDGTITSKDTLPDFIKFAIGKPKYYLGLLRLSLILIGYKLKIVRNDIAKEVLISYFFAGWEEKKFRELATEYSLYKIDYIVRPKALERLRQYQYEGDKIVVVSASIQHWLEPWCKHHNLELLCTSLEVKDTKLTGRFAFKNCSGTEKANRIRMTFDLDQYKHIIAYGDSKGDMNMFALADEVHFKPFRKHWFK